MLPTGVLRAARAGFGLRRGHVRVLSTRFAKVCLAHRDPQSGVHTQLRLVQEQPETAARLHGEMAWLHHLATQHRLAVPAPTPWRDGDWVSPTLLSRDGSPWRAVACAWVAGVHIGPGLTQAHLRRAGALLARVHRAGEDAPPSIAPSRPTWWVPRLFELATTLRDVIDDTGTLPASVSPELATALRRAAAALAERHAALPVGPRHEGLIHTDAHWQNMRWTPRRVGLVDFEDFANGRFLLDVACFLDRVGARHDRAALSDAILEGYDRIRPLPTGAAQELRVMQAFRRLDYAGWVLSWPRVTVYPWGPAFLAGAPAAMLRLLGA